MYVKFSVQNRMDQMFNLHSFMLIKKDKKWLHVVGKGIETFMSAEQLKEIQANFCTILR